MKPDFKLYLITDSKFRKGRLWIEKLEAALSAGVKAVQLREKDLPLRELLCLAQDVRRITRAHKARLFINDRLDVVLSADAEGLHAPEEGPPTHAARVFLPDKLIGRSVHSREGALQAEREGADFITFSPIFPTASKQGVPQPKGLQALADVASAVKIPVFALGGITPGKAASCLRAGACGIAVISAILNAPDPAKAVDAFRQAMGGL